MAHPTFDTPGAWKVQARAKGHKIPFSIAVNPQPATLVPGTAAPKAPSPTTTDTLGVKPICTRVPMCRLHTQSLSTVIGAGKPVAALFATPARCQSQYCAPVLDEFLKLTRHYGDQIVPVHIEIYKATTGTALVPTLDAWHIASEPWLFGIDAAGDHPVADRRRVRWDRDEGAARRPGRERAAEPENRRLRERLAYENDWPQPQLRSAFGLLMANPAPWRPSL